MRNPPFFKFCLVICLALFAGFVRASDPPSEKNASGSSQAQFASIIVNERTLTGPNSSARRVNGRIFVPLVPVARSLGDTVTVDAISRTVNVRRQNGTSADLDARLGQIRENGALIMAISNSAELVFSPNADELLLPVEIVAPLLDASIRYDDLKKAVIIDRGGVTDTFARDGKKGRSNIELYQIGYQYDLNQYTGAPSQNLLLTGSGRLWDGRFTFSSNSSIASRRSVTLRNSTVSFERPNGQQFVAGDLGTSAALQFLSTTMRGGAVSIPWKKVVVSAFGGKTFSGSVLRDIIDPVLQQNPHLITVNNRQRYDTTVFGFSVAANPANGGQGGPLSFSGGALRFTGPGRSGDLAAGSINYSTSRFRLQGDLGVGNFSGYRNDWSRFSGPGMAVDLSGTFQVTEALAVQGRYAYIGSNFVSPQAGLREPISVKAAGATWSPTKWFSASVNASTAQDLKDRTQTNKYITATFTVAPGGGLPRFYISHTENSTSQVHSSAFTMLTASKDFSRFRVYLNATRSKILGPALVSAQLGSNFSINDSNSIEFSQGAGSRGALNGQFDWRTSNLLKGKLSFSAGGGYNRDVNARISTFERVSASVVLPGKTSLQVNYVNTNAGPTLLVTVRGSLFRKREAQTFLNSPTSQLTSYSKVSGRVYQDIDLNGRYDAGTDKPQAEVKIRVDGNRYVVSDENGVYEFDAVPSGEHKIYLDLLSVRADLTVLGGDSKYLDLARGRSLVQDFRLVRTGRISGQVWLDSNENGKFDEGETPLADVRVVTASGRDTLTDIDGYFSIADLPPGEHVVLIDNKTVPEKSAPGFKPKAIRVLPGEETGENLLPVIVIPAEVKRFGAKGEK